MTNSICPRCHKEHADRYDVDVMTDQGQDIQPNGCFDCWIETWVDRFPEVSGGEMTKSFTYGWIVEAILLGLLIGVAVGSGLFLIEQQVWPQEPMRVLSSIEALEQGWPAWFEE